MAGNGAENRLNPKQARVLAELLNPAHRSQEAAAKAAGVPRRTLQRWLAEDEGFIAALRAAEEQVIGESVRRLVSLSPVAVATIAVIMADRELSATVRLRAAQATIDNLVKLREARDFEQRLAALEAQQNEL